jgi:hypothetical protein
MTRVQHCFGGCQEIEGCIRAGSNEVGFEVGLFQPTISEYPVPNVNSIKIVGSPEAKTGQWV